MEKVAIIEITETNINLLMLKIEQGGYFNVFDKISENVKLGQSVLKEGIITSSKIAETLTVLRLFRKVCDKNGIEKITAIATSFVKNAKNQKSFFDEIYNNTAFSFTVLSEEEEVKTIYSGAINYIDVPKGIIIDIEPNSTHIVQYNRRTVINVASIPCGAETLAEKFADEPQSPQKAQKMEEFFREQLEKIDFLRLLDIELAFVGAGSYMLSIGRLARKAAHYPLDLDNNYVMSTEVFDGVYKKVQELDLDKTSKLKGISEDRADSILAAMSILKTICGYKNVTTVSMASTGFEEGVIFNYVVPAITEKPLSDMLAWSLESVRLFFDQEYSNTENVYNLALILFKQLKVMHKLPRSYVKALKIAASMYDCGIRISYENYSAHSLEVIVNTRLSGVAHKDLLLAGFACKLQNQDNLTLAEWVKYKDILDEEDLDAVRKLGIIINLASSLDRSHDQNVLDVSCDILGDSIIMKTIVKDDATFDVRQGMKISGDFRKVFKKNLQII